MRKVKILADLKPALDGYAGIPEESRLLFHGLRQEAEELDIEGLLQHGNQTFVSPQNNAKNNHASHQKILWAAKTISSICKPARRVSNLTLLEKLKLYVSLQQLRGRALWRRPIKLGAFETAPFQDFIWTRLFSKSLSPAAKSLVTSAKFKIIDHSRSMFHYVGLPGFIMGLKPCYLHLDTSGYDFLIAQTPYPARVSRGTQLIIRYHDAIPLLMPHTIQNKRFHLSSHYYALRQNIEDGALFVCNSRATKSDLISIFPEVEPRTSVIYNIVSEEYYKPDEPKQRLPQIIAARLSDNQTSKAAKKPKSSLAPHKSFKSFPYLLMVSTLEPRKNHKLLISAWQRLTYKSLPQLKLVLVGNKGWDSEETQALMKPWVKRGKILHLENVPKEELRVLYHHASATICPSLAEGFDYSGIESMRCGGLVIASDILVHREVFRQGAAYFNPYSIDDAVMTIERILSTSALEEREELRKAAKKISKCYTAKKIIPQWQQLLTQQQH